MNILREVRRVRNKSMPVRIMLLLAFCVIFVASTYAWFSWQKDVTLGGLEADVTPWDIAYYVEDDFVFEKVATFVVDEFYPGMPERQDNVHIYNLSSTSTDIQYELISVKVFGQEVLKKDAITGKQYLESYKTDESGNEVIEKVFITSETVGNGATTTIFAGDTSYPFELSYTYDKTELTGEYIEGDENSELAHAQFYFFMDWAYEGDGTDTENLVKDILDTQFGKKAYEHYKDEGGNAYGNEDTITKALEVKVRITSNMGTPVN